MLEAINTAKRLLLFKINREEILAFNKYHLWLGLLGTWVVGMGRYWDDPKAKLLQHLGLGSVIYIFVLAFFIWLVVQPFRTKDWSYQRVLTFISLTSFPAILYAIPVEQFQPIDIANNYNVLFLAVVAFWRVCLLFYFMRVFAQLGILKMITVTLLPLCIIVTSLFMLNLHHVVFNIMGGVRETTAHDGAYGVLMMLTIGSVILVGPLFLTYISLIVYGKKKGD